MHRFHNKHRHSPREFDGGGHGRFGRGFGRHGRGEREFGGEHEGRGRRGRFFGQGDLRLVLLQLSAEKPSYGYEFIKAVEERASGLYSPSPGVVYPTLTLLEELGQMSVETRDGKKLYAITDVGRAHLADNQAVVDAIFARLAEVSAANRGGPPVQILRAMENLKTALRLKLGRGALDEDKVRAIAAELDAVTGRIEEI